VKGQLSSDPWLIDASAKPFGELLVTTCFHLASGPFMSPEGRTESSPGLQPWERHAERIRPESTSSPPRGRFSPSAFRKDCLTRASESSCFRPRLPLEITPGARPPFQGDSLGDAFPGLKPWAVLFSPFGRLTHTKIIKADIHD